MGGDRLAELHVANRLRYTQVGVGSHLIELRFDEQSAVLLHVDDVDHVHVWRNLRISGQFGDLGIDVLDPHLPCRSDSDVSVPYEVELGYLINLDGREIAPGEPQRDLAGPFALLCHPWLEIPVILTRAIDGSHDVGYRDRANARVRLVEQQEALSYLIQGHEFFGLLPLRG